MKTWPGSPNELANSPRGGDRLVAAGAYVKLRSGLYAPTEMGLAAANRLREELPRQCGIQEWATLNIERDALRYGPRQLRRFSVLEAIQPLEELIGDSALAFVGNWLASVGVGNRRSSRPGYTALQPDPRLHHRGSLRHSLAICERETSGSWKLYVGVESVLIAISAVRHHPTIDF